MQTTLERSAPALRHRFDVDDYHRMAEAGILSREDRFELIEGEIVDMAPIGNAHGGTTRCLTSLAARIVADGKVQMRVQGSLRLDRGNEPQPDLMLLRPRADFYRGGTHRRRSAAPGRDCRYLPGLRPRPPARALCAPRRAGGVDRRPSRPRSRTVPGTGAGWLRRALSGTEGMATPTLVPGLDIDVAALLA